MQALKWCDVTISSRNCSLSDQEHRANSNVQEELSTEAHYRATIFIPFLDQTLQNIDARFSKHTLKTMSLGCLIPQHVSPETQPKLEELFRFYHPILPSGTLQSLLGEYEVWIETWRSLAENENEPPSDALSALQQCESNIFPLIHKLLQVIAIQPVTTASAERSFSNLRRLKTWLRATMGEDGLSGLALMSLNRDKLSFDDVPEILNRFAPKKKQTP